MDPSTPRGQAASRASLYCPDVSFGLYSHQSVPRWGTLPCGWRSASPASSRTIPKPPDPGGGTWPRASLMWRTPSGIRPV